MTGPVPLPPMAKKQKNTVLPKKKLRLPEWKDEVSKQKTLMEPSTQVHPLPTALLVAPGAVHSEAT